MKNQGWRASAAVLLLLVVGCGTREGTGDASAGPDGGDGGAADPGILIPTEGTRLKARWMKGPEGQSALLDFYDTKLAAPCTFRRAADGELRCLPEGLLLSSPLEDFADGACTAPALRYRSAACVEWAFVRLSDTSSPCEYREHIYALGDRIVENLTFSRRGSPPRCLPAALPEMEASFRLGPEMPASMFVKATEVPQASGDSALEALKLQAEDGASYGSAWQNRATGQRCEFWNMADQRMHCFPAAAARVSTTDFSDATCGRRIAFFSTACGTPAVALYPAPSCPIMVTPVALGPAPATPYLMSAGMCTADGAPEAGTEYRPLESNEPSEGFPPLDFRIEQHEWRLERLVQADPTGAVSLDNAFQDIVRKERCVLTSFGGGKYRCAPASEDFGFTFADPQCTQPLYALGADRCPPAYVTDWDVGLCPPRAQFYALDAILSPRPTYTQYRVRGAIQTPIKCLPTSPALGPGTSLYSLKPIPEDQFAEVTLIEPK